MTDDWAIIEAAARAEASARVELEEKTKLEFGLPIAWSDSLMGRTEGFTPIHRVGFPIGSEPFTTCGVVIPAPVRWLILSPALVKTMDKCEFCRAEYQRAMKTRAA